MSASTLPTRTRRRTGALIALALSAAVAASGFAPAGAAHAATAVVTPAVTQNPTAARLHPSAMGAALNYALSNLGRPYRYGGAGPVTGFDCSGLTMTSYAYAGVALPRTARAQYAAVSKVPLSRRMPGDLLFWASNTANPDTIYHVAIDAGAGMMIAAPHSGTVVQLEPIYTAGLMPYVGRPVAFTHTLLPVLPTTRGDATSVLQRRLRSVGFGNVSINGVFDRPTSAAVRYLQNRFSIREGGVVGGGTWSLLVTHGSRTH